MGGHFVPPPSPSPEETLKTLGGIRLIVEIYNDVAAAVVVSCCSCGCYVVVVVIMLLYLLLLFNKTGENATGRVKLNIFRVFKASYLYLYFSNFLHKVCFAFS